MNNKMPHPTAHWPVPRHQHQRVDGDVGGDVDDVLRGPAHGHWVSLVSAVWRQKNFAVTLDFYNV